MDDIIKVSIQLKIKQMKMISILNVSKDRQAVCTFRYIQDRGIRNIGRQFWGRNRHGCKLRRVEHEENPLYTKGKTKGKG